MRIEAADLGSAANLAERLRAQARDRRPAVLLDIDVLLAADDATAAADLAQLENWAGAAYTPESLFYRGGPAGLLALLGDVDGLDGVVLRPLALAGTVAALTERVLPVLRRQDPTSTGTLRDRLGLPRPVNRYATA